MTSSIPRKQRALPVAQFYARVPAWGQDYAFLALTVSLTASLYVTQIGLYSDDWNELSRFGLPKGLSGE